MLSNLKFYVLALRIACTAWVLLFAVSAIFSFGAAFVLALIVYPVMAVCWGFACAWWQWRALSSLGETSRLLSAGADKSINVALPAEQALRLAESALRATFLVSAAHSGDCLMAAQINDPQDATRAFSRLLQTRVAISVVPQGVRATLKINCDSMHFWLFGFLIVDGGRCVRHLKQLEAAIQERLRLSDEVIDNLQLEAATRAQQSAAALAMLRAQIEPHFIFNTLAHIRASLGDDKSEAQQLLDALVNFLRSNSHALGSTSQSLKAELQMVEAYLNIIQLRHAGRLQIKVLCGEALMAQQVPSACILALVENAVKHGIEQSPDAGKITVTCTAQEAMLNIVVENSGPPFAMRSGKQGGLSNLQERLKLMYGASSEIEFENTATGEVSVQFSIPIKLSVS